LNKADQASAIKERTDAWRGVKECGASWTCKGWRAQWISI